MKKTVIEIDLMNKNSVKNALKELRAYKHRFDQRVKMFVERLGIEGIREVKTHITAYDAIDTQELLNSIWLNDGGRRRNGWHCVYVIADSPHACFVEFGTGIVGKAMPYTFDFPKGVSWNYDVGKSIFTTKDGRRGWIYTKDGEHFYFTSGQESRPFMAQSMVALMDKVDAIAEEVFNE